MLRSIFGSFARSYGRQLGRVAARHTSWLAIPVLIGVIWYGIAEYGSMQQIIAVVLHAIGR
ncbi:hypothetical protein K2Z83_04540 [Oscillochloris sp. ZM17-4]|uniref:hypothetical protein n=1 Tax=Oscillochloris sp. ZM17-4 TaxID=2866714 RepID=UPI001C73C7C3|nr:hypothetical protein [Oscillochloris sp. ZM17-4]MBX0326949.1 hypothetical protein [Oscillochloris sp. ZM17-4]